MTQGSNRLDLVSSTAGLASFLKESAVMHTGAPQEKKKLNQKIRNFDGKKFEVRVPLEVHGCVHFKLFASK